MRLPSNASIRPDRIDGSASGSRSETPESHHSAPFWSECAGEFANMLLPFYRPRLVRSLRPASEPADVLLIRSRSDSRARIFCSCKAHRRGIEMDEGLMDQRANGMESALWLRLRPTRRPAGRRVLGGCCRACCSCFHSVSFGIPERVGGRACIALVRFGSADLFSASRAKYSVWNLAVKW